MGISQTRSKRKVSGSRYKDYRKKRYHELGSLAANTGIGIRTSRTNRIRNGKRKTLLLRADNVNVFDINSKKHVQAKIESVIENPANRHFVRRGILTKGAVIKTSLGDVKITSRPGQGGSVEGVLLEK